MNNQYKFFKFFFIWLFINFSSCKKPESFPIEPVISELSFIKVDSSYYGLTFRFTDGDGDLGLNAEDTMAQFACDAGEFGICANKYYFNLFIQQYIKENGTWAKIGFPFDSRFRRIATSGKNKAINGILDYDLTDVFPFNFTLNPGDTIKYVVQIVDRELHESNELETQEIILIQ
jgi:hypothetical protein